MESKNEFYKRLDRLGLTLRDRVWSMGFQLSVWLVVGHGVGLYLLVEAMKDGQLPQRLPAELAYTVFVVGLICSVASMWTNLLILARLSVRLDNFANSMLLHEQRELLTNDLEAKRVPRPKEWDELDAQFDKDAEGFVKAGKRMWRVLALPVLLSTVSIVSLLAALVMPLRYDVFEPLAGSESPSVAIMAESGSAEPAGPGASAGEAAPDSLSGH